MKNTKQHFVIFTLFFSLFFTTDLFCQIKNFGIKFGLNLANATLEHNTSLPETKNKIGFNITTFYEFLNFKNLGVSLEAGYAQKGYDDIIILTNQFGQKIGEDELRHRLNYIDISIISKLFFETKFINPYLSIGPVLGFYTGYKLSHSNSNNQIDLKNPILEDLNSLSFGVKLGAGMELKKIIPFIIFLEGRYNPDLTYSYDKNGTKYKNRLFQINLGIKF